MSFGPEHYVPVLKVKRGEKHALRLISEDLQARITPILEIVVRTPPKTVAAHLDNSFAKLSDAVRPYPKCFIDTREIAGDGVRAVADAFRRATEAEINFTPVTGISRIVDIAPALAHATNGIAIRLTRAELEQGGLGAKINGFMREKRLSHEQCDLIMDLGPVENFVMEGIASLTEAFMSEVPNHSLWRTFTISSCAFPRSMGVVDRNSHELVERAEWLAWKTQLYEGRQSIERVPTFSDCAIQHPAGVEGFDPKIMAVSAAIRYTLEEAWLLIKGESTRRTRPGEQFPALARRLVYGDLREHYLGKRHCAGCTLIKSAADGESGLGSAEAWRKLGSIHHISLAAQGVASLSWP